MLRASKDRSAPAAGEEASVKNKLQKGPEGSSSDSASRNAASADWPLGEENEKAAA